MSLQLITNRQFASPSAANSPSVAAAGVAWSNTAWVEIAATTDTVWLLTSVISWISLASAGVTIDFEIDIGIGAAGFEVVIATVRGRHANQGLALYCQPIRLPIPIDGLNGRHAFRLRTSGTRTDTWNVSITYLKNSIGGTLLTTSQLLRVAPSAAAPVTVTTSSGTWVSGTPAEIIASAAADLVITHAMIAPAANSGQMEFDLCTGAASSEVPIYTFRVQRSNPVQGHPFVVELPNPLDNIPAGTRVSMRGRSSAGTATAAVALMYLHKPL